MAPRVLVPVWIIVLAFGMLAGSTAVIAQEEGAPVPAADPQAQPAPEPASDPATPPASAAPAAAPDRTAAEAAFEAKFGEWKRLIVHLRELRSQYQTADAAAQAEMQQDWNDTVAKAEKMLPELVDAVVAAYQAAPNVDRDKTNFLVKVLKDYVARDKYQPAVALGKILTDNQCDDSTVYSDAGIANYSLDNFDEAEKLFAQGEQLGGLSPEAMGIRDTITSCKEAWAKEQELRQKEAAADDLPRVKLTTSKGDIVIELFENEAPETVANFISLVKKPFYDGLTFHRVLSNFMAQGGCPVGDGTGGPGYTIYDEFDKPDARAHFRGSLSMAKTTAPNSGGSQFFIAFRPVPQLNGRHTVFGRVIEGMDVVDQLQRRNPDDQEHEKPEPDRIIKAEVLRDRNHEYVPHKVE